MKIEELQFSLRVYNCLKRKGIDTVEQLIIMSDDELLKIRCFGIGCLKEVRDKLAEYKDFLENPIREYMGIPEQALQTATIPIVMRAKKPPVYLPAELEKAIRILQEEYEKTRNNSYIHNPVAWALYHTWKRIEENR